VHDGSDVTLHFMMSVKDSDSALDDLVKRGNYLKVNDKILTPTMIDEKELFIVLRDGSKGVTSLATLMRHICNLPQPARGPNSRDPITQIND